MSLGSKSETPLERFRVLFSDRVPAALLTEGRCPVARVRLTQLVRESRGCLLASDSVLVS